MSEVLNNTARQFSTIVELVRYRSIHQANQRAFTFLTNGETEEVHITYGELDKKARAIGTVLQQAGAKGERALLLHPPGLEYIAAFLGCLYAEVIAIPTYPPRPNQSLSRLEKIIADAQAKVVLTTTQLLSSFKQQFARIPDLEKLSWIATDNLTEALLAAKWQQPLTKADTLAFLQYTSGSTATPRGVMVSHGNLIHNEQIIYQSFQFTERSIVLGWLPFYHDMGLIGNMLQPLYAGVPCIFMSPVAFLQKPLRWLKAIARYKATISGGPNFAYDLCTRKITPEQRSELDLSSWEVAFNGAEPVRQETIEQFTAAFESCGFRQEAFYPCYGMAEATLFVSGGLKTEIPQISRVKKTALEQNKIVVATNEQKDVKAFVSCGQAILDQKIVIANPERLTKCSADEVGEIWVSGSSIAKGYWNRPLETQQTFQAKLEDEVGESFLRTGDLGFIQNGNLFVTGRLKDLIIIRGHNYYPQDIEQTSEQSHPALRSSCVAAFGVEVNSVERLVIVQEVERTYLRQLDVNEVTAAIRQAISKQHDLQVYAVLLLKTATIPKTSSGKIQRNACRKGFLEDSLNVVGRWTANSLQINSQQLQKDLEELQKKVELSVNSNSNSVQQKHKKRVAIDEQSKNGSSLRSTQIIEDKIQAWLISHLALSLQILPSNIDIQESFAHYGVDSSIAVNTTGELMDWLECELEPTLFWEYHNIESVAKHVAQKLSQQPKVA